MWQARWMLSLSLLAVRAFQAPRSSVGRRTTRGLAASTLPAEVVFENINVFGLVKRTMAAATHLKPGTLKKVAKAMPADDFVAVVAFFLVLDPALNLMWRLRGGSRSFNDSWFGTLRPALKLLSSVFGTLYALDVLYCASCLIGNPLPNVIPAVAAGLAFPVVSLLCFHLRLAAIAQTTNESVRGVYRHARNSNDKGCRRNCATSIAATLRGPLPPSRLEPLFARPCADQSSSYGAVPAEP